MPPLDNYSIFGQKIFAGSLRDVKAQIANFAKDQTGRFICCRDVSSLIALTQNGPLCEVHRRASLILPDGMPLVWLGHQRGKKIERCAGPDLMHQMLTDPETASLKHMFFGGETGVAQSLAEKYKHANLVGAVTPKQYAQKPVLDTCAITLINEAAPDIVWVGLSSPKQDYWMLQHHNHLNCTLIGVGAAFDFHAGKVKRAPKWMQKTGFEWLFRLLSDPKRLGPRYVHALPRFLLLICRLWWRDFRRTSRNRLRAVQSQ